MPAGPGKYDQLCTIVRQKARAEAAIVVIVGGERGSGFSVQGDPAVIIQFPEMLEEMAKEIRESMRV
jgi:hypothetical protein